MSADLLKKIRGLRRIIGEHCEIVIRFEGSRPVIVGATNRRIALEEAEDETAPADWQDLPTPRYLG